jgi:hypothetical protein
MTGALPTGAQFLALSCLAPVQVVKHFPRLGCCSDRASRRRLRTGPARRRELDAARYGGTIRLAVDRPDQRNVELRQAAQRHGVTHTASIGLTIGNQMMGALNIYNSPVEP